jgi:uncharacterized protein
MTGGLVTGGAIVVGGYATLADPNPGPLGAPKRLRIATGPAGGVFRVIGAALARVLRRQLPDTRIQVICSGASVDNLAMLTQGAADLCLASLDTVTDLFTRSGQSGLTAIARLYDSWMQVLVLGGSQITALAQLDNRPVAAGTTGSATRFCLTRLAQTTGVTLRLVPADQDEGVAALAAGAVDGFATFTGAPTPAVTGLVRSTSVRLLPLADEALAMTGRFGSVYTAATLPSTTYQGVGGAPTLTTPNLLLARQDLNTTVVEVITAALFTQRATIARGHPEADQINVRSGIATMPVRLHPGAIAYYRSIKP